MRLRVYRSLLGPSYHYNKCHTNTSSNTSSINNSNNINIAATEDAISSIIGRRSKTKYKTASKSKKSGLLLDVDPVSVPVPVFDGAVLSLPQLQHVLQATDCFSPSSPSPWMRGGPLYDSNSNSNTDANTDNNNGGVGFMCQLQLDPRTSCHISAEPPTSSEWEECIQYQFNHLSQLLMDAQHKRDQYRIYYSENNKNDDNNHDHGSHDNNSRPLLDMVILQAPSNNNNNININAQSSNTSYSTFLYEYLSHILPSSAIFLESLPPSTIGLSDRNNIQGRPLGQHVRGISHAFLGSNGNHGNNGHGNGNCFDNNGVGLDYLEEVVDIFPPTRFVLHPTNLKSRDDHSHNNNANSNSNDKENNDNNFDSSSSSSNSGSNSNSNSNSNSSTTNTTATPSISDTYGLEMGIEAVVDNTDAIRVSPSTFYVNGQQQDQQQQQHQENQQQHQENNDTHNHGLFGAGTLFGEIWCVQQLDGAMETYVICDEDDNNNDNDNNNENDNKHDNVTHTQDDDTTTTTTTATKSHQNKMTMEMKMTTLAQKIRVAYNTSQIWRDGAEDRRREEMEQSAKDRRKKKGNAWLVGQYGPEVAEAARLFGLYLDDDEHENDVDYDHDDDGKGNGNGNGNGNDKECDENNTNDKNKDVIGDKDKKQRGRKQGEIRLTTELIRKRWNVLAFQSHPDTTKTNTNTNTNTNTSMNTSTNADIPSERMSFSELRRHFLTLMKVAKQEEDNRRSQP